MSHSTSDAHLIEGRDLMIDEYEELFHSAREMREAQARYRQALTRVGEATKEQGILRADPAYTDWLDPIDERNKVETHENK